MPSAHVQAQIDAAKAGNSLPVARKPAKQATTPPGPREGRTSEKEAIGPKANTPLRYATAGPLHAEQFPGEFRCTVTGPLPLLPALVAALDELTQRATTHPLTGTQPT